jgi:hypothetical protein
MSILDRVTIRSGKADLLDFSHGARRRDEKLFLRMSH